MIAVICLIIGWVGGLTFQSGFPDQKTVDAINAQLTDQQTQNTTLQAQIATLSAQLDYFKAHPQTRTITVPQGPHPCMIMPFGTGTPILGACN